MLTSVTRGFPKKLKEPQVIITLFLLINILIMKGKYSYTCFEHVYDSVNSQISFQQLYKLGV